jgi:hypothetical protein
MVAVKINGPVKAFIHRWLSGSSGVVDLTTSDSIPEKCEPFIDSVVPVLRCDFNTQTPAATESSDLSSGIHCANTTACSTDGVTTLEECKFVDLVSTSSDSDEGMPPFSSEACISECESGIDCFAMLESMRNSRLSDRSFPYSMEPCGASSQFQYCTDHRDLEALFAACPSGKVLTTMLSQVLHSDFSRLLLLSLSKMQRICVALHHLTLASACSGTDIVAVVLPLFFRLFANVGLPNIPLLHIWSCEMVGWRAMFCSMLTGVSCVFKDISELCRSQAAIHPFLGGRQRTIVPSFFFFCGFSCRSVSTLNFLRHQHRNCIAESLGSTGVTWKGVVDHLRSHLPILVFLENVRGFTGENLRMARSALLELGYLSVACTLDLTSCGFRVRRSRLWLLAVLAPTSTAEDGVRCQSIADRVCKLLRIQCAFDADSLLVSRSSLSYLEYLNSFRNQRSKKKSAFSSSNPRWITLHERFWKNMLLPNLPCCPLS